MNTNHEATEETRIDTTVQLPDDDAQSDTKSFKFKKGGGTTPVIKGTTSSFISPKGKQHLASMAGDYVDNISNTTSRKASLIAGEGNSFITSLAKQHNGMNSSSPSRIRRFGNTGLTGLPGPS